MNPIEASFAVLKAWIKAHQDTARVFEEDPDLGGFGLFLEVAIEAQQGRGNLVGMFRYAGYEYSFLNT